PGRRAIPLPRRGAVRRPLAGRGRVDHPVGGARWRHHLDLRCLARGTRRRRAVVVRTLFRALFGLILRVFFRRIEVSGVERVPEHGPVIFVLNHPNGLIDPAFLLCLAPRRVSLLAKAPLFRMPVIGFFCRAFQAIPVHRRQDASSDPSQNRETFDTARAVLARGGAIAIFPEGTSHSDPKLRPLKTGAARIAFGAAAALAGSSPIRIVPAGLYYRAKRTFRSAALLYFGGPFAVDAVALAPGRFALGRVAGYVGKAALLLVLLLPAALVGVAVHYPAYRAVGFVATGLAKGAEDALASIKVLAAMLLFPVTWIGVAAAVSLWQGTEAAVLAFAVAPLTAYAALVFFERLDRIIGGAGALSLVVLRPWALLRVPAERRVSREEIVALGRAVEMS